MVSSTTSSYMAAIVHSFLCLLPRGYQQLTDITAGIFATGEFIEKHVGLAAFLDRRLGIDP